MIFEEILKISTFSNSVTFTEKCHFLASKAIRRHFLVQKCRHGIDEGPQISLDTHNILIRRIEASKYDFKEKVKNHPYVALLIHIRAMCFKTYSGCRAAVLQMILRRFF